MSTTERTKAGEQHVLAGAEHDVFAHVSAMTLAPLKPKVWQKPCDHGLFSDQATQSDLVDIARRAKP